MKTKKKIEFVVTPAYIRSVLIGVLILELLVRGLTMVGRYIERHDLAVTFEQEVSKETSDGKHTVKIGGVYYEIKKTE